MPEIEIRPAVVQDIETLIALDHNYISDYVWQMEMKHTEAGANEETAVGVGFRQIRLPRSVRVEYPRHPSALAETWKDYSGLLVAVFEGEPVGYIALMLGIAPLAAWVTDIAVKRRLRRQGIGTGLVLSAQVWGLQHGCRNLILELQSKNYPGIQLAYKLGFDFCGYNDRYFTNHDIALFFAKALR